jgi:hypothetical protein
MMCLGWKTKSECKTRGTATVPGTEGPSPCPDITWFYVALGLIGIGAMMQHQGGKQGAVESAI